MDGWIQAGWIESTLPALMHNKETKEERQCVSEDQQSHCPRASSLNQTDDLFFTMTAFLPAKRPLRTTTTFPGRRNLAIVVGG